MRKRVWGSFVAVVALMSVVGSMTLASGSQSTSRKIWSQQLSSADATSAASVADHGRRLVVVSRNETETEIDNPPDGEFSQGDEDVVTSPLYRNGQKVGRLDVHLVFTQVDFEAGETAFQVTFTSTLEGGQVTATGVGVFSEEGPPGFDAAVTGGTGAYWTTRGEVHVSFGERAVTFVYHLN